MSEIIITDASAFITGHQLFDVKHIWRSRWEFFLLKASALQLWSLCFRSSRCILCDQTCQDLQVQQQRLRYHTHDELSVIAGSTIAFSTKCEDGNQASGLRLLPVPDQDADDPVDALDHRTDFYTV